MQIYLLIDDDGFRVSVEKASVNRNRICALADEYNGADELGPYYVEEIELEDFKVKELGK